MNGIMSIISDGNIALENINSTITVGNSNC